MPLLTWPNVDVDDKFQVVFWGQCNGQRILNTFGYVAAEIGSAAVKLDAAYTQILDKLTGVGSIEAHLIAVSSANYTLDRITVQLVKPDRWMPATRTINLPGALPDAAQTQNVAASIERRGIRARRTNVGRIQVMIPQGEDYINAGLLMVDYKGELNGLAGAMLEKIEFGVGGNLYPAIWPAGVIGDYAPIVATRVQDTVRVMRRRTVGLGI